uniref:Bm687, isoform d n=1 Tax=Brugia malayi TaxID=6279 RepID=A0A1I9G557_BRUMA|nr:Bm687, isoform d [Brugia malayi]
MKINKRLRRLSFLDNNLSFTALLILFYNYGQWYFLSH